MPTHLFRILRPALSGCVAACLVLPLPALAAQQPALDLSGAARPGAPVETRHLSVATAVSAAGVKPGERVTLFVDVTPKPGMHVYSPEQKDFIPVGLTLAATDGLRPGPVTFPKPEKYFFAPLKETQLVFSRTFRIAQEVTPAGPARPLTIKGTLRYQACDEAICYVPQNVPVSWMVTVR
jgi:DsbC/DsbD-like thiol-disulfide interchange protein